MHCYSFVLRKIQNKTRMWMARTVYYAMYVFVTRACNHWEWFIYHFGNDWLEKSVPYFGCFCCYFVHVCLLPLRFFIYLNSDSESNIEINISVRTVSTSLIHLSNVHCTFLLVTVIWVLVYFVLFLLFGCCCCCSFFRAVNLT